MFCSTTHIMTDISSLVCLVGLQSTNGSLKEDEGEHAREDAIQLEREKQLYARRGQDSD